MTLLIVESPTKARTLSKFLDKGYAVVATVGHIKDLPKSKLGVDLDNNFEPDYVEVPKQEKIIKALKKEFKKADQIYLATDPDREGEVIAKHVQEIAKDAESKSKKTKTKRIVFHEITQSAVEHAIANPKDIDMDLVNAQYARRVLDRLVGYKLSPLLWKKVRVGLSAGRVQTVTVRLIVEKEREIEKFAAIEYWEIATLLKPTDSKGDSDNFETLLVKVNDNKAVISNKKEADNIVAGLNKSNFIVKEVIKKEVTSNPYPPFTTSTLTQTSVRFFGWGARKTMSVAQKLYEEGLITYHRTDSVNIASSALNTVRNYIQKEFGDKYLPSAPRFYKKKQKSAQEAHEAVRPTSVQKDNDQKLSADNKKLYELIKKRFIASQMASAVYDRTTINVEATESKDTYLLRITGQINKFDGWRKVLPQKGQDEQPLLPNVSKDQNLTLLKVNPLQKFTQPPARFNEASLIKTLEKLGIGRPSTYAPTIYTIQQRRYVEKKDGNFYPTHVGIAVNDFLLSNFNDIFDYNFTAQMEEDLDKVASGKLDWQKRMKIFYAPLAKKLKTVEKNAKRVKIEVEKLGQPCPDCGKSDKGELVIRVGRFGKFISCSRFPDCKHTEKFVDKIGMVCPDCGEKHKGEVIIKRTKKGRPFYGCSRYPDCKYASWKDPRPKKSPAN